MDDEATAAISPHLAPGEKLLWTGRPLTWVYAFYNGGGMGCFGLFCLGGTALQWGSWRLFLIGLPILAIPALAATRGRTVRYGLTGRRAIITATWPWTTITTIPVDRFNTFYRQENGQGVASIMFRKTSAPWNIWRGTPFRADAFVGISDADEVAKLIHAFEKGRPMVD